MWMDVGRIFEPLSETTGKSGYMADHLRHDEAEKQQPERMRQQGWAERIRLCTGHWC